MRFYVWFFTWCYAILAVAVALGGGPWFVAAMKWLYTPFIIGYAVWAYRNQDFR